MGIPIITPGTGDREQSITDIIESVALEQAALSHILNAEGEKLQQIVGATAITQEMLDANNSVKRMVGSIANLEMILQSKLGLFGDCLCPVTTTSTTTTSTTTTTTTTTLDCNCPGSDWGSSTNTTVSVTPNSSLNATNWVAVRNLRLTLNDLTPTIVITFDTLPPCTHLQFIGSSFPVDVTIDVNKITISNLTVGSLNNNLLDFEARNPYCGQFLFYYQLT